jgi:hypothetical protein
MIVVGRILGYVPRELLTMTKVSPWLGNVVITHRIHKQDRDLTVHAVFPDENKD